MWEYVHDTLNAKGIFEGCMIPTVLKEDMHRKNTRSIS